MDLQEQLKGCKGLSVELCGTWIWVSGNTKKHKELLKKLGLQYARKKQKWYLKPAGYKYHKHKPISMEKIRFKYGSETIV